MIRIRNKLPIDLKNQHGIVFCIGVGDISGDLAISSFVTDEICEDAGFSLVEFVFRTADGQGFMYQSILNRIAFWPSKEKVINYKSSEDFFSDARIKTTIYGWGGQTNYELMFEDGSKIVGSYHYTGVIYEVCIKKEHLEVKIHFSRHEDQSLVTGYFTLPIDFVFWRKAPKIFKDDVIEESQGHVQIDAIGGELLRGIEPSSTIVKMSQ